VRLTLDVFGLDIGDKKNIKANLYPERRKKGGPTYL
jgi:hypothetical protein